MTKESSSIEPIEQMLTEIQKAKPSSIWENNTYRHEKEYKLTVTLPHGCFIYGRLRRFEGQLEMFIQDFLVIESLRNRGIGTRLLRSFAAEAKLRGATLLVGDVVSPEALRVRASVFGQEALSFSAQDFPEVIPTYQELLRDFDKYEFHEIEVDLTKIDTSAWELPTGSGQDSSVIPSFE